MFMSKTNKQICTTYKRQNNHETWFLVKLEIP